MSLSFPRSRESMFSSCNLRVIKPYYVSIMASKKSGTLYIGVTDDLHRHVWQHKNYVDKGFTKKYGVHYLVWFEATNDVKGAIRCEKQMKKWNRQWKIILIERENPEWADLYEKL